MVKFLDYMFIGDYCIDWLYFEVLVEDVVREAKMSCYMCPDSLEDVCVVMVDCGVELMYCLLHLVQVMRYTTFFEEQFSGCLIL